MRRAFLCGEDSLTGKNYEHRKAWVIERLRELADIFAIDICAYAVMSNHYHLVLRVDIAKADAWEPTKVAERWEQLFGIPILVARYLSGETATMAEAHEAEQVIETWRGRLTDISWFMRSLNEHLARRGNEEDNCKGRFWEGRFRSQALLDEAAVLTCMSYVDLNPIRAGMAGTPEQSDFTSIQQRIERYAKAENRSAPDNPNPKVPLMPLVRQSRDPHGNAIGFTTRDYLQLVDWAGRIIREGKRGAIAQETPLILERIGLSLQYYLEHVAGNAATEAPTAIGRVTKLRRAAETLGKRFIKGAGMARQLYMPQHQI